MFGPCRYVVVPGPDTCGLTLRLSFFHLLDSPYCGQESLQLAGQRLCGDHTGEEGGSDTHIRSLPHSPPPVSLQLPPRTEAWELLYLPGPGSATDRGFLIQGLQTPCQTGRQPPPAA